MAAHRHRHHLPHRRATHRGLTELKDSDVNEMTSNQAADPKAPQPFDRRWLALAVIAVAPFMTALDTRS
jgi:hypothetical protein